MNFSGVRWYYSTNGKAEGPVTFEFLVDQLKASKFTLVDLVFKEGESAWKTFGEIPEFRDAFQAPPPLIPPPPPAVHMHTNEIDLDEISIDDFTPTPIHAQNVTLEASAPPDEPLEAQPVQNVIEPTPVVAETPAVRSSFYTEPLS